MTVFSARAPWSRISLFSLLVVTGLMATGCPDLHVGRLCSLGQTVDAGATSAVTSTGALECPSRICILPNQERTTKTTSLCTAECESDDDCADGEKWDGTDSDRRCRSGFACRRLFNGIASNELACKRLFVCKDFLRDNTNPPNNQNCNGDSPIR